MAQVGGEEADVVVSQVGEKADDVVDQIDEEADNTMEDSGSTADSDHLDEPGAITDILGFREEYTAGFEEEETHEENINNSPATDDAELAERLNVDYGEDEDEDLPGHGNDAVDADTNNNRTRDDTIVDTVFHQLYQNLGLPAGRSCIRNC